MSEHTRFEEDHRKNCNECFEAWLDFIDEQREEARLDAMIESN